MIFVTAYMYECHKGIHTLLFSLKIIHNFFRICTTLFNLMRTRNYQQKYYYTVQLFVGLIFIDLIKAVGLKDNIKKLCSQTLKCAMYKYVHWWAKICTYMYQHLNHNWWCPFNRRKKNSEILALAKLGDQLPENSNHSIVIKGPWNSQAMTSPVY